MFKCEYVEKNLKMRQFENEEVEDHKYQQTLIRLIYIKEAAPKF